MNKRNIDLINWEQLWKEDLKLSQNPNIPAFNWDEHALEFKRQYAESDYRDKLLDKIQTGPQYSVLDVGCGPGNLAIPLASRCRNVTALDKSREMLRLGQQEAIDETLANIAFMHADWNDIVIGKDIEPHDIVVCSRALSTRNPKESLLKLNRAAKKRVYLTLRTNFDQAQLFYSDLYRKLGKEYSRSPDYIYGYNLLYQEGIPAHVDFIDYTDSFRYQKVEDAFQIMNSHISVESLSQKAKMMSFINDNMNKNGGFKLDVRCKWALLWWEKAENHPQQ